MKLVGEDGNAFAILGRCRRAAKRNDWTDDEFAAFTTEAKANGYDHLLRTVLKYFEEGDDEL